MLAAPVVSSGPVTLPLPQPKDDVARFADNFAIVLYILCRCPLREMHRIVDADNNWNHMMLKATPAKELRLFFRKLFYSFDFPPSTAAVALYYIYEYFAKLKEESVFHTDLQFIVAALVLSNKFHDDVRISLKKWSRMCGIPVADITECELSILKSLNWDLNISVEKYHWWGDRLHNLLQIRL